jgi:hypothetical protein
MKTKYVGKEKRKTKADENFEDVKTNCLINYIKDESPKNVRV